MANFVTILDEKTNEFVLKMMDVPGWIGLEKVNGEWVWPDGTKATYLAWNGSPSGDGTYVEIHWNGSWNDLPSDNERGAVCQIDSKCSKQSKSLKP